MKEIDAAIEALDNAHGFLEFLWRDVAMNDWASNERDLAEQKVTAALAGLRSLKEQERYGYVVTDTRGMQYFYKDTPYLDTAVECQEVFTHPAPEQTKQFIENFDELKQEPVHIDAPGWEGVRIHQGNVPLSSVQQGPPEAKQGEHGAVCPHCGSDRNERDELCKAEREVARLTAQNAQLLEALKKIATVNAMDYEYQEWASAAIAQVEGKV